MLSKTHAEKVPHVTFGIHKKQSFVRTAAGFEHMLNKTHAEKVPHVTFGIHKKQSFVRSSETFEQQQGSSTC